MRLPLHSNFNRHLGKLTNILRTVSTKKLEQKIHRNPRSFQSSISSLYRQSVSLIKKEKEVRMTRMKIDKIRRQAERLLQDYSMSHAHRQESDDNIEVVDSDNSEIIVTQDDLEGEEQLERLENMNSFDSGIESFEKHCPGRQKLNHEPRIRTEDHNSDPLDLSYSSFTNQSKSCSPTKHEYSIISPQRSSHFDGTRPTNIVTSTPIINNLPSRRSADDHLEQFMMVDPNQNVKWKQLADKFNKELGPNVCGVCHKTLSCKSALTMHYRVHTEERPFVCKVCEKRFSTKGNLKTHLGQHADVTDQYCMGSSIPGGQFKPGSLMVPPSAMPSPTALNSHNHPRMQLHHPGFPFGLPGLVPNSQILLNMFNHSGADFHMMEALKASQKVQIADGNSNFLLKTEETINSTANNVSYSCNFCRQNFPSKLTLELHLRTHNCTKELFNSIQNGKFPVTFKERILASQQQKPDSEQDQKSNGEDNEQNNNQEKFSLTTIMGLHNHPANLFSFMNTASLLHRPMMPPFPGFVPPLISSNHASIPRMPMPGNPMTAFGYSYSDIENNNSHK